MKKYSDINNISDLNRHMAVLKTDYTVREQLLKRDAKNYVKQFTPMNLIKKYLTPSTLLKADDKLNISSKVISWVLPLLMNSTIFRGSGLLTKALVGIASNKIGKKVDADSIVSLVDTVKSWFSAPKLKRKSEPAYVDYGIPPDSETY
jgi:hypothetical protein